MQGDADIDLTHYPDAAFDYVVLSRTLQAVERPREVLRQMLRIGERAVVSFPNFGHWLVRWQITNTGRMPMTATWNRHWYETPNIHPCTIRSTSSTSVPRRATRWNAGWPPTKPGCARRGGARSGSPTCSASRRCFYCVVRD